MKRTALWIAVILISAAASFAQAPPPDALNYQGVLRNADGSPLNGDVAMVFRFYTAPGGGDEIVYDTHPVVGVAQGLFNVTLGSPGVADGSGPGSYTSLSEAFRDYMEVFLEVEVEGEILSPRVQIVSAAYSLNSSHLDGWSSDFFVNVSPEPQVKGGELTCVTGQASAHLAWVKPDGDNHLGYGIEALGDYTGGYFEDTDSSGAAFVAVGDLGIDAQGSFTGGHFADSDGTGHAYIGFDNRGIEAHGTGAAGYFVNDAGSGYAFLGQTDMGIRAYGDGGGGYFKDEDDESEAWVASGHYGIHAVGFTAGGWFQADSFGTGAAWLGYGDYGIRAEGSVAGGWFDKVLVDGMTETSVLKITGGADVAEPFPVRGTDDVLEGAVVVIDDSAPGALIVSSVPYDYRVAGVISGGGGIQPGVILSQGEPGSDEEAVALMGRVYCLATTENGPILPGDLLTTSSLPGHAMKATDRQRSHGATLGKAMSTLEEGEALVLVLVNLQ